jgi:hypothetical protein
MRRWRLTAEILLLEISKPLHDELTRLLATLGNHFVDQAPERFESFAIGADRLATAVSLSDSELAAIMDACRPLQPHDRDRFPKDIAAELAALPMLGDGAVHRAIVTEVAMSALLPKADIGRAHWDVR